MFDSCFDNAHGEIPRTGRGVLWLLGIAAGALTVMAGSAGGQLPGAPVLQNAWAMPGMAAAFNMGGGGGGSVYAGAGSWTPNSGRFQLSGGVGSQTRSGIGTGLAYGFRAAVPLVGPDASVGFGAFAGIGGTSATNQSGDTTAADSIASAATTRIPVGVAIGWRHTIASRGFSVYATPSYVWTTGGGESAGLVRAGLGVDAGITNSIGVTGGVEFGQTRNKGGGPSGTVYGIGVSYAFGRR